MFDTAIFIAWFALFIFLGIVVLLFLPQLQEDLKELKNALSEAIKEERRNAELNQVKQAVLEDYFNEACKNIAEESTVTKRVELALTYMQRYDEETEKRLHKEARNHTFHLTKSDYAKFHVINRLSDYISVLDLLRYFLGGNVLYVFYKGFQNASNLTSTSTLKDLQDVLKAETVEVIILFIILIAILHIFHATKRFERAQKDDVALL